MSVRTRRSPNVSKIGQAIFAFTFLTSLTHGKVIFPEDMQEVMDMIHSTCVGNTGVNEADISNCEKGTFADDKKLGCYMYCLMEEASFVDDDGIIDYDMLLSMIPEESRSQMEKMINECKHLDVAGRDSCDKSLEIHQCLYKSDPSTYFLF